MKIIGRALKILFGAWLVSMLGFLLIRGGFEFSGKLLIIFCIAVIIYAVATGNRRFFGYLGTRSAERKISVRPDIMERWMRSDTPSPTRPG